jgi:hypothetical protein
MAPENKEVYQKRDFLLGEIHANVKRIPQIEKDVKELHGRMVAVEVKSGLWGLLGGISIFVIAKLKTYFGSY